MTQPTPYHRSYSFTDFSASSPSAQQPGVRMDAEFDAAANTLSGVLANLAMIQRDDGRLANGAVGIDTLGPDALALIGSGAFTLRGAWLTATVYAPGDIVTSAGQFYLVATAHTSGVLATDIAAGRVNGPVFDAGITARFAATTGATLVGTDDGTTLAARLTAIGTSLAACAKSATLAAIGGAALIGFTASGAGAATRTVQDKLREGLYSSADYSILPTSTTPAGWYNDFTNPDGAGAWQLKSSIPNTVSMAGGAGVQGVGLIFNGSTSAATPNAGLAETNLIRMFYTINAAAGQKLQCHLINGMLTVNHDVGSSGNEGAIFLGTMRANGPAIGGSNVAIGLWGCDFHVEKALGVASGKMVAGEFGVHAGQTQTYGDVANRMNGLEVWSGSRSGITGAKAHTGIEIFGDGGWTNLIRCRHTDNATEIFKIDGNANLTATSPTGDIAATFQTNQNSTNSTFQFIGRDAGGGNVTFVAQAQGGGQINMGAVTNHPLVFVQNNAEIFRIGSAGLNLASGKALQVNAVQVVGARSTGWTAMTGTTDKATVYDTSSVTLPQLAGRVMALQAALTTHGLIGA